MHQASARLSYRPSLQGHDDGPARGRRKRITVDVYEQIGRQFGMFLRRSERFFCEHKDVQGIALERAALTLLGRIVAAGPVRLSVLAEDADLDLSTVSRQAAALQTAGLVARTPDAADRRASVIEVTTAGADVYARHKAIWHAALHDLLADWTITERSEFARLFTSFNEKIAAHRDGGTRQEITQ